MLTKLSANFFVNYLCYLQTSALSGTTCVIIAESAKQIHSVCLSVRTCLEKGQVAADSDWYLGHATALP